jgi:hypothetical protein
MLSHTTFGIISVVLGIIGYIPYYRNIFKGLTKPHPFTWFGFSLLNGITFVAQVVTGGGAGAWVTLITAFGTLGIALLSLTKGEKDITRFDITCFLGAIASIAMWKLTASPLVAVIIVVIADVLTFLPTYRKAYLRPYQETATLYFMSVIKYVVSVFALGTFTFTTALFPVAMAVANGLIVIILLVRRGSVRRDVV